MNNNIEILSPISEYSFSNGWYELAKESHFWMQWRFNTFLKRLKLLHIPLDQNLCGLDIGCGHGTLIQQTQRETKWIIDGVDLDLNALKNNTATSTKLYYYNIFDHNKKFEQRYDFIILFDVIEHIEDTKSFLNACQFHLKPQGLIFVNVPAFMFFYSRYDEVIGHLRRYNKTMLKKELLSANLEILDMAYWGALMTPLLLIRKFIYYFQKPDVRETIKQGFQPAPLINQLNLELMKLEHQFLLNPMIGTSIISIAQKK